MYKRREKLFALTMAAAVMLAGFSGCSKNNTDNTAGENTDNENTQPAVTEEESKTVPIEIGLSNVNHSDYSYSKAYISANYIFPVFLNSEDEAKYENLAKAFAQIKQEKYEDHQEIFDQLTEGAKDYEESVSGQEDAVSGGMSDEHKMYVMRSDSKVVSILDYDLYYEALSAHPSYEYEGDTIDSVTGEELELSDIIKDTDAFMDMVRERLQQDFPDEYEAFSVDEVFGEWKEDFDDTVEWTLDPEGINVYFNVYQLGSYASGAQIIHVPFADNKDIFAEICFDVPESYVIPWIPDTERSIDINGDGTKEIISLQDDYNYYDVITDETSDDMDYNGSYYYTSVIVDGEKHTIEGAGMYGDRFLVYANEQYYIYIFQEFESDSSNLIVFDLKNMSENNLNSSMGVYYSEASYSENGDSTDYTDIAYPMINTASFRLRTHLTLMGTVSGYKTYQVGADGTPVTDEESYVISNNIVMKALQDIDCVMVDSDGKELKDGTIPAGNYIRYVGSDDQEYVDVQIIDESNVKDTNPDEDVYKYYVMKENEDADPDGDIYRIYPVRDNDSWENYINDLPESEVLQGVVYVG